RKNVSIIDWSRVALQIKNINGLNVICVSQESSLDIGNQAKPFARIVMPKDAIILVVLGLPREIRRDVILIVNPARDSIGLWG
ncbi:hypothetical protein LIZ85_21350, partial [[Eubacterium] rectale]|nr:hypothetical protein [Agathobacter rectalis]